VVHVDFFVKVIVELSTFDISLFAVEIKVGHEGEDDTQGGELHTRCGGFVEVRKLGKTPSH
jgi:hypothetical protein